MADGGGLEPGGAPDDGRGARRFLCDAMLGSLARWLRFFGYDAAFLGPEVDDLQVAEKARSEGRWLLTRDHELAAAGPRSMLIRAEDVESQLVEVFTRLGLSPEATLGAARCSECNGTLEPVDRCDVAAEVPPYVLATAERFTRCSGCGRIYWPGTHTARILSTMAGVVERLERTSR